MLIPTYNKLFNPVIEAIKNLGGSAKNDEILSEISKILKLTDEEASELYNGGNRSVLDYRVAWAKSYLKVYGINFEDCSKFVSLIYKLKKSKHSLFRIIICYIIKNLTYIFHSSINCRNSFTIGVVIGASNLDHFNVTVSI